MLIYIAEISEGRTDHVVTYMTSNITTITFCRVCLVGQRGSDSAQSQIQRANNDLLRWRSSCLSEPKITWTSYPQNSISQRSIWDTGPVLAFASLCAYWFYNVFPEETVARFLLKTSRILGNERTRVRHSQRSPDVHANDPRTYTWTFPGRTRKRSPDVHVHIPRAYSWTFADSWTLSDRRVQSSELRGAPFVVGPGDVQASTHIYLITGWRAYSERPTTAHDNCIPPLRRRFRLPTVFDSSAAYNYNVRVYHIDKSVQVSLASTAPYSR